MHTRGGVHSYSRVTPVVVTCVAAGSSFWFWGLGLMAPMILRQGLMNKEAKVTSSGGGL